MTDGLTLLPERLAIDEQYADRNVSYVFDRDAEWFRTNLPPGALERSKRELIEADGYTIVALDPENYGYSK